MIRFSFEVPPEIHFGVGALDRLPETMSPLESRILVVSGARWLAGSGWKQELDRLLSGQEVRWLACTEGEPSVDSLTLARDEARSFEPQALVAIGGGSVMDTAKALSALLPHPGGPEDYLEGVPGSRSIPGTCVPWIAIPTTAGTGAEVTKNAVVRHTSLKVKKSMRSQFLMARSVIVEPRLAVTLSPRLTGISGLDALTQLVEAYVSKGSTQIVRSLVAPAFPLMLRALARLATEPENLEARTDAAYGAMVSGIALANAGLGAAHGFASAVGGMFDVPHGLICAVTLPLVLEANAPAIREGIVELARAAGLSGGDAVVWLAEKVRDLLRAYGLPPDLRGYQIPRALLPEIAEKSSGSSMRGNPRELSMDERVAILSEVI